MEKENHLNGEGQSRIKYAVAAFLCVLIFVITYKYVLFNLDGTDLSEHTKVAQDIYLDRFWAAWLKRPYLLWHLCVKGFIKFLDYPVQEASACACACFASLEYFITFFLLSKIGVRYTGRDTGVAAGCISFLLGLVMPLYKWWFNGYQYEGQFSINPVFNPTHMAVKPFGLLAFALAVDMILKYKEKQPLFFTGKRIQKHLFPLFAAVLLLSAFTKPTFMYMLLPAGAVYLLIDLGAALMRRDGSWKKVWGFMWRIACACLPSLVYLAIEYCAFYLWGGTDADASIAVSSFLEAWHLFSPDVPTSICLAMAFPLWMFITNVKYFFQSVEGRLSIIGYAAGTLEFSFFVETGTKFAHLNFAWCMMSGMLLFWVVAGARLMELTVFSRQGKKDTVIVTVGWILLAIHFFSGLYYLNPGAYIL